MEKKTQQSRFASFVTEPNNDWGNQSDKSADNLEAWRRNAATCLSQHERAAQAEAEGVVTVATHQQPARF